ncbi:MAG: ATP synthase F1 subunit gamma [Muribaculaceae bacterium]|nr:ATP synthase F1 subunit gamma [Muribaculaceae bacterium]
MATLRDLKGRIGSVASSEKITGAMKMISSAKMHKAEQALKRLMPFRQQVETIIENLLSADAQFSSPLLVAREVKRVGVVVFGSDDGLCGAYNVNIFRQLVERIADYKTSFGPDVAIDIYPVGSKMSKQVKKLVTSSIRVVDDCGVDSKSSGAAVKSFVSGLQDRFLSGEVDRVDFLYMNFKSVSRQVLKVEQLLPVVQEAFGEAKGRTQSRPYIFEPDATRIFTSVLPLFLLSVMQEVFTENRASEQAARVMAMQSANDNAKKLLEQLQLEYNKLRQQSITNELLDIVGGQIKN